MKRLTTSAGPVSPFVIRALGSHKASSGGRALDVPCGGGRHAIYLAQQGYEVSALDVDPKQLLKVRDAMRAYSGADVHPLLGDATQSLPFADDSFDLVVTTHFVSSELLAAIPRVLRSGGLFVYETFAGHGENWRALPKRGQVAAELRENYDLLDYRERPTGPPEAEAVVVQVSARRL